jgi:hypothetical protein
MSGWTKAELEAIAQDDNLYLSIPNADGSLHRPTWIWVVQAGEDLYARGGSGISAKWYQSAKSAGHGHVSVGGVEKEVIFEFPEDTETNDLVDKGYELKYVGSSYIEYMCEVAQRDATIKFIPIN